MKNKKRILSQYKRSIIINNKKWTYQINKPKTGEYGFLKICNPKRTKKYSFRLPVVGKTSSLKDYESCPEEYDGSFDRLYSVSITPAYVRRFIIKNILSSGEKNE